ncbi:MAG: HypC/HybG/HupF family hydrogenase formation chaperone [Planctomycetota bacterium]
MCLAIPGRIESVSQDALGPTAHVRFGGVERAVSLAFVPEATIGDWVLVHVGFAISRLDEEEAARTLALFDEIEMDPPGGEA